MSLTRIIKEDKEKVSIWKRDTEEVIQLLERRKKELKHGDWGKYLVGVGIPRRTAYDLLNPVQKLLESNGRNRPNDLPTHEDYDPPHAPPQSQYKQPEIEDIPHEEIEPITNAKDYEKKFDKEHTPKEPTLPKNMPEEYWVICSILEDHTNKIGIFDYLVQRKSELERIHNNTFTEWQSFLDLYFKWFEKRNGDKPNVMMKDYANAKRIIIYLRGLGSGDAVSNWNAILSNWSKLDKWQQNRTDLTSIHTDMNKIISQLKNGKFSNNENVLREVMRNAGHEGY